jgi:hypothetical protein
MDMQLQRYLEMLLRRLDQTCWVSNSITVQIEEFTLQLDVSNKMVLATLSYCKERFNAKAYAQLVLTLAMPKFEFYGFRCFYINDEIFLNAMLTTSMPIEKWYEAIKVLERLLRSYKQYRYE